MSTPSADRDPWDACPPGELQRMVGRTRIRQRRRFLKRLGGTAAGLAAIAAGGFWLLQPGEYHFGGIACSEVMSLLPDYRANKLPAELKEKVSLHLAKCPECGPHYRGMSTA